MNNCQLSRHGQNRSFARSVRKLWRGTPDQSHYTCRIDDAALGFFMFSQAQDCMFTAIPDTLDVDIVRQIPNLLWSVNGICIITVHDACIVEDYIDSAPSLHSIRSSEQRRAEPQVSKLEPLLTCLRAPLLQPHQTPWKRRT